MSSMKLDSQIMKKIERFALIKMRNNDILHRKNHTYRVIKLSGMVAKGEGADFRICKAAVLLHDIEKGKKGDHAKLGADISRKFLEKINLDEDIIERICYAIYRHNKGLPNKTIESRVVHDADKLDGIGARGFLRHVVFETNKSHNIIKGIKNAVREHEKFYNWLQTKTAKKTVKQRMGGIKLFLKYLK